MDKAEQELRERLRQRIAELEEANRELWLEILYLQKRLDAFERHRNDMELIKNAIKNGRMKDDSIQTTD